MVTDGNHSFVFNDKSHRELPVFFFALLRPEHCDKGNGPIFTVIIHVSVFNPAHIRLKRRTKNESKPLCLVAKMVGDNR